MKRAAPWLLALSSTMPFAVACGDPDNAVLELRLQLPRAVDANGKVRSFARIAVVGNDVPVDPAQKLALPSQTFSLAQLDADGCNVRLSVVARDPVADKGKLERARGHGLSIVIWFCPTRAVCDSRTAPRWLFDFDHALWPGERTFFEAAPQGSRCSAWGVPASTLPTLQAAETRAEFDYSLRVGECDVLGCLDEASQPAQDVGFCTADGVHPCE